MNDNVRAQMNETMSFVTMVMVMGMLMLMIRAITKEMLGNPSSTPLARNSSPTTLGSKKSLALSRWNEILRYCHTIDDIKAIANRQGIIKLYHGAPTEFAEIFVREGPMVPYKVEDTARYVAKVYNVPWVEFQPWAYRVHEVVGRLSTATAPVAARWAWSFPLGEILTDLNSHMRMFIAFKKLSKEKGISLDDAYDEIDKEAVRISKEEGLKYTIESAPDILGLPDRLALEAKTGALVEIEADARALPESVSKGAQGALRSLEEGYWSEKELVASWNHQYKDIKIAPGNIRSARIIIRDMQPWEQDLLEEMMRSDEIKNHRF